MAHKLFDKIQNHIPILSSYVCPRLLHHHQSPLNRRTALFTTCHEIGCLAAAHSDFGIGPWQPSAAESFTKRVLFPLRLSSHFIYRRG